MSRSPSTTGPSSALTSFVPTVKACYPVLMSCGPYGKGLHFGEGFPMQWKGLTSDYPEVLRGSTGRYANWETADPERWVPFGYVCIRVDSRGAGRSPGVLDCWSAREIEDFCDCIEWAAQQPWCNGKIGLAGVSYYATTQWQVAAKRPETPGGHLPVRGLQRLLPRCVPARWNAPHLPDGVVPETGRQRPERPRLARSRQSEHRRLDRWTRGTERGGDARQPRGYRSPRVGGGTDSDSYYEERTPDLAAIEVPVLSCGNWGGHGVHLRGNVQGWLGAGSKQKWMEFHGREHWTEFYTDYGVGLQKRFCDHSLKGEDNGWDKEPPIRMLVRHVDGFVERTEDEWPLARTQWTRSYLTQARLV